MDILKGKYKPPAGVYDKKENVLAHLKCYQGIRLKMQPGPITCEEYRVRWMKVNDRIPSIPSGLHVGHWKYDITIKTLNWVIISMANTPFLFGYSPQRWQNGIHVILENKKGDLRADKLRIILLFEADFNLNNKYVGRDMTKIAEKAKLLAKE